MQTPADLTQAQLKALIRRNRLIILLVNVVSVLIAVYFAGMVFKYYHQVLSFWGVPGKQMDALTAALMAVLFAAMTVSALLGLKYDLVSEQVESSIPNFIDVLLVSTAALGFGSYLAKPATQQAIRYFYLEIYAKLDVAARP